MYKSFERSKAFTNFKKAFGRILVKKPNIVFRGNPEEIEEPTIFLCNHGLDGSKALWANEIYFPYKYAAIGQFEVFLSFRKRWRYLYTFNHRLRRGLGKLGAWCKATFEAIFVRKFYKLTRTIPSYKDLRVISTIRHCHQCLNEGISLMIYPEHLDYGYNNVFLPYISGFSHICKNYYERTGKDVKICPVYYSQSTNQIIIDTPLSANELFAQGLTREEISKVFTDKTNQLYMDYVIPFHEAAEKKYKEKNKTEGIIIE